MPSNHRKIFGITVVLALTLLWQGGMARKDYFFVDALFLVGVFLLISAAIGVVSNSGIFEIVTYSVQRFSRWAFPRLTSPHVELCFAEYRQRSRHKHEVGPSAVIGVICMLSSAIGSLIVNGQ